MICPTHLIDGGEAGCPLCRRKDPHKPKFGEVRKPLKKSSERPDRMSAAASVQSEVAGHCILCGFMPGDCGVQIQRCHIVSQELLRDIYKYGAYRAFRDEFWRPIPRDGVEADMSRRGCSPVEKLGLIETITCQQILDDSRNLVHGCENHNKDGQEMVDALDRRKAALLPSYPDGFAAFTHEFRFSIEGSTFWYWQPFDAPEAAA